MHARVARDASDGLIDVALTSPDKPLVDAATAATLISPNAVPHAGGSDMDILVSELDRVLAKGYVTIHFQPIVSITPAAILGWEALTRGPSNSPLHSPLVLFEVAAHCSRLVELERMLLRRTVARFAMLGLPGRLFLNVTADSLLASLDLHRQIAVHLSAADIPPSRVVVELTETRAADDPYRLDKAIAGLRQLGFVMAIDDLGEGFASLKRWTEMRPDFVKIDRHFIDGIHTDTIKQQFVRSIVQIAERSGSQVIAEGLEREVDLQTLVQLGITLFQGYLLGRPSATPRSTLPTDVRALLQPGNGSVSVRVPALFNGTTTASRLASRMPTVTREATCHDAIEMFRNDPRMYSLPVLDDDQRIVGVLRSLDVFKRSVEPYFMDIHGRHSCTVMMDTQALIFDVAASLRNMSDVVANLDDRQLVDGFLVTDGGRYFGSGRMTDLIKAVSDLQVACARYANPLTLLPGNVPINEYIATRLTSGEEFVVAYADLDNFKAYNDVYGYRAGDELIQLTANVLSSIINPEYEFVGHVGGDDFVAVLDANNWAPRLAAMLADFDNRVVNFYTDAHRQAGGVICKNRQGVEVFHPLATLSIGVVRAHGARYSSVTDISAALAETKARAKALPGSVYFADRRIAPD